MCVCVCVIATATDGGLRDRKRTEEAYQKGSERKSQIMRKKKDMYRQGQTEKPKQHEEEDNQQETVKEEIQEGMHPFPNFLRDFFPSTCHNAYGEKEDY